MIRLVVPIIGTFFKATMFHTLLTYSTMTAVVLHALLGCCVHHAHAGHTHSHDVDQVMVDVPHVVGLQDAGHDLTEHFCDSHKASCQHQRNADGSIACNCFDDETNAVGSEQPCLDLPCSGSPAPHESCDEADCNIVADQRDNDISLILTFDWSPLLTSCLSLSSQELLALRTEYGSPPDPHCVQSPLRLKTQVWRL
ncbi:hypothetical protein [Roseimaritima ulvae]|uniref:Uncharacterized protein n=1 Tax=Roseimaritima ulvae TaxID=980254 RepID=A0A5B9QTL1_9BACT|nr:hypothetical protein [Roseimaritima ulvae]QEG41279.1 hypothetical protein UC8_32980 [Roseimaritima ulvae]